MARNVKKTSPRPTFRERWRENFGDDYIPIDPGKNAYLALKEALGQEAVDTAKCPSLDGFVRLDTFACGCIRHFRGEILGMEKTEATYEIKIRGIEGVKPCPQHRILVEGLRR